MFLFLSVRVQAGIWKADSLAGQTIFLSLYEKFYFQGKYITKRIEVLILKY